MRFSRVCFRLSRRRDVGQQEKGLEAVLTETEIQQKIARLIVQRDENKEQILAKRAALKDASRPDAMQEIQQIATLINATAAYAQITARQSGVIGALTGLFQALGYQDEEISENVTGPNFSGLDPSDT